MRLDSFLEQAALELQAFAESYRQHLKTEPEVYDAEHDMEQWWQEFYAYQNYLVLQERVRGGSRA